jgi:hypothetical protein
LEGGVADQENPEEVAALIVRLKDNYENYFKGIYYLLVGNGAGLIGCITALRDYATTPHLKGVGTLIELFGYGILTAMVAFVCLLIIRMEVFAAINHSREPNRFTAAGPAMVAVAMGGLSFACFGAAILIAINHLSGL